VDEGKCKRLALSDVGLEKVRSIVEAARIKPGRCSCRSHPYLPEWIS